MNRYLLRLPNFLNPMLFATLPENICAFFMPRGNCLLYFSDNLTESVQIVLSPPNCTFTERPLNTCLEVYGAFILALGTIKHALR